LPVAHHYDEAGKAAQRITARLGGTADSWYRSNAKDLRLVRVGDWCLVVDGIEKTLEIVSATDTARDGSGYVVAYESVRRNGERRLDAALRKKLIELGLRPTKTAFRTKWLDLPAAIRVIDAIAGARTRGRLQRSTSLRDRRRS
jgi:hypothetical protein